MSTVGDRIREAYELLKEQGIDCVLEWNQGNHFKEADIRTAKAFAWVINSTIQTDSEKRINDTISPLTIRKPYCSWTAGRISPR